MYKLITTPIFIVCLHFSTYAYADAHGNSSNCGTKFKTESYLDIAQEMITKAKSSYPICEQTISKPIDCEDVLESGEKLSKIYTLWPKNRVLNGKTVEVFCDMDTDKGGWTVIQRRGNYSREKDYFFQDWQSYKSGFGDVAKDFWLGNDNIFALSNQKLYSIRFDLQDIEGNKRYALYDTFWIDDEDHKYTLHIKGYGGNAGDSMVGHNDQSFSTKDRDNDKADNSCAEVYKGGWWYSACHTANLNGLYLRGKHESFADGIEWKAWKGYHESMESTEIKIRSKDFKKITHLDEHMTPH